MLGHKDIKSTMIYINLEQALFNTSNDEFHVKTAKTAEEACKLAEVGFINLYFPRISHKS